MFEAEAVDGRGVVVPDLALGGIESHALADNGGLRAVVAPDCEGQLEANNEGAVGAGTRAESMAFTGGPIEGSGGVSVEGGGGDVPPHVEALHDGRWGRERAVWM